MASNVSEIASKSNPFENGNYPGSQPPPAPPMPARLSSARSESSSFDFKAVARTSFEPVHLHFAINEENYEKAKKQVDLGIDLDFVVHGQTPLFLCLLREQYDIALMLIFAGADVTIPEIYPWKRQPVHLAAKSGHTELLEALLGHGASLHAKDAMLFTPLHWASSFGCQDAVIFLLQKGADIHARDDRHRTSLFRAASANHGHVVTILVRHGADVDAQDRFGWGPLHQSVLCCLPIVNDLLLLGANPDLLDMHLNTPLHLLMMKQTSYCIQTLSNTDLHYYTREYKITSSCSQYVSCFITTRHIISSLLDYHADVNIRNEDGHSAFDIAAEHGKEMICSWLLTAGAHISPLIWGANEKWPLTLQNNPVLSRLLLIEQSSKVPTLKKLAKVSARQCLHSKVSENIQHLPIPLALKHFLHIDLA